MITKYGEKFEGVVANALNPTSSFVLSLKMTRSLNDKPTNQQNGVIPNTDSMAGAGPDCAMDFDLRDVADIVVNELSTPQPTRLQNGK